MEISKYTELFDSLYFMSHVSNLFPSVITSATPSRQALYLPTLDFAKEHFVFRSGRHHVSETGLVQLERLLQGNRELSLNQRDIATQTASRMYFRVKHYLAEQIKQDDNLQEAYTQWRDPTPKKNVRLIRPDILERSYFNAIQKTTVDQPFLEVI